MKMMDDDKKSVMVVVANSNNTTDNNNIVSSKDRIGELLEKRNKIRQITIDENKLNKKNLAENENHDYFKQSFTERSNDIQMNLDNLKLLTIDDLKNINMQISNTSTDIQELQNYLSTSTLFLPDYTIKSCQKIIGCLITKLEEIKIQLIPKRKFGFKNKPKIVINKDCKLSKDTNNNINNNNKHDDELLAASLVDEIQIDGLCKNKITLSSKSSSYTSWTIENRQNAEIILIGDSVNDKDVTITSLSRCLICIRGHPGSLQLTNLENCVLLCGPVGRSIFATNCRKCTFAFSCQQLRLHTSVNCEIYLHVTCRGIIEDCCGIQVAPYNYTYPEIDIDFGKSGLDINKNKWNDLADFNWLSTEKPSPNWSIVQGGPDTVDGYVANKRITNWSTFIDLFRFENKL